MAEEVDEVTVEAVYDDFSHQGCYVFNPSTAVSVSNGAEAGDEIDDRPRKKRKSNPPPASNRRLVVSEADDVWPRLCSGAEPPSLAKLRQETYKQLWEEQEAKIDVIVNNVDQDVLQKIKVFVRTNQPAQGRLTSALLVSGAEGGVTRQLLQHWATARDERPDDIENDTLVQLQRIQAPNLQTALRNLIRLVIEGHSSPQRYTDFLAEYKKAIPMNFDLELLQNFVRKRSIEKVIIAISDIETLDLGVLSELLSQLAMWSDRIPFSVILGIATTVELFESRLSKATIGLLDAQVFDLGGTDDQPYKVFSAMQHSPPTRLFIGPATASVLYEMTEDQSTTVETFRRALKHIYMSHFFANPLSALLCSQDHHHMLKQEPSRRLLCEAIRNTPSFQSYCSASLNKPKHNPSHIRNLLSDDAYTLEYALTSIHEEQHRLTEGRNAISVFISLYTSPTLNLPRMSPFELDIELSQSLFTLKRALTSTTVYADLISSLRLLSPSSLAVILASINAPTISNINDLIQTFSSISPPPSSSLSLSLAESHLFNHRHPFTSTFSPRPRHAIERALSQPSDYLSCDCCTSDQRSEPTSILYSLLDEAGRDVNVRDLWETFYNVLAPILPSEKAADGPEGKEGEDDDDDDEEEGAAKHKTHALALFYRALAELKMLGLVISASSKTKGIDVISKTTWKGL